MRTEEDIEDALSLERFSRYVQWAEGSHARALELYAINMQVSEALYTPMQMLEVALRNRIHSVMRAAPMIAGSKTTGFLPLPFSASRSRRRSGISRMAGKNLLQAGWWPR